MKSSSQVTGLPLMGVQEGMEFGTVQDIVIDPQTKRVQSLILRGAKNEYDYRELKLSDIIGIGKDYVITQTIENAVAMGLSNAGMALLNIRCIASSGDVLGNVKDFVFDEKTGVINSVQLDTGAEIPGESIMALSNNLLFVTAEEQENNAVSSLEQEQQEYMLGRVVKNDIRDQSGQVIIEKGTVVTADVIRIAEAAGVIIDLTLEL
ncbi:MAG: PRC-barrel domain-containing protein [Christensenellales bacterium]|jgi:uncharacterized protein YrrD